jgi:hypothetical protein
MVTMLPSAGVTVSQALSRKGLFSNQKGTGTSTPSSIITPGDLSNEGLRAAKASPSRRLPATALRRVCSMIEPRATLRTLARTAGSTAEKILPSIPPWDWPMK